MRHKAKDMFIYSVMMIALLGAFLLGGGHGIPAFDLEMDMASISWYSSSSKKEVTLENVQQWHKDRALAFAK